MAKWRLTAKHYLNVPGTEVAFEETDRDTGVQARKVYPVPKFLDPENPRDCNRQGDIIVVHGKADRGELVFLGDPTPEMEPLDDEAQAISDALRPKWSNPIEDLPDGVDYSAALIASFEKQMTKVIQGLAPANVAVPGVDAAAFAEMQKQLAELMAQNAALKAESGEPKASRRA